MGRAVLDRALVLGGRDVLRPPGRDRLRPSRRAGHNKCAPHIRKKPNELGPFADALMNTRRCSAETNVIEFDTE
jgi:hypothetical protein